MNRLLKYLFIALLGTWAGSSAFGQTTNSLTELLVQKQLITRQEADSLNKVASHQVEQSKTRNGYFAAGLEFRPRIEYRDGYRQLPTYTSNPAIFLSHRSRLNVDFALPKFKFHTSIQDVRTYGQGGIVSASGTLNVYEAYADAYFNTKLFLRIGRQKTEIDNGRLLSASNWTQLAKAHDGINLIYQTEKWHSELMNYFNQTSDRIFETTVNAAVYTSYKSLTVHYLRFQAGPFFKLSSFNAADGYESVSNPEVMYLRGTSGGRIEFEKGKWYATVAGYYQYGQIQSGRKVAAYYLQPELKIAWGKLTTRLGAEYMSGDNGKGSDPISHSFVPLYGVAWRFMGNLDYFTAFPSDLKNGGLIDPYLFHVLELSKKHAIRLDAHFFYLQNNVLDANGNTIDRYLGNEYDLSWKYHINDFTTLDFGVCYMFAEPSMETLKGGTASHDPLSSYLMVTFNPELFRIKI